MKRYHQVAAAFAAACLSLNMAQAFDYQYGEIPVVVSLCGGLKSDIGFQVEGGAQAGIDAEAGVGIKFAVDAEIQAALKPRAKLSAMMKSSAVLQSQNCVDLVNTKSGTNFGNLSPAQRFLTEGLLSDTDGKPVDPSELALELISSATAFNASVQASRAGIANFGVVSQAFTDAITGTEPLSMQSAVQNMGRVFENSAGIIPTRIRNSLSDPEQLIVNHLQQLDFVTSSCNDLNSGEIENLTAEMMDLIGDACLLALDTQLEFQRFIDGTVVVAESGAEAAQQIGEVLVDGQTVQSVTTQIERSVNEVEQTADVLADAINGLDDTIDAGQNLVIGSLDAGKTIVTGSFDSIAGTTQDIGSTLSDAGSTSSGNVQLLKGEVDRTLALINGLSLSAVTELPGKLASVAEDAAAAARESIANEVCDRGVGSGRFRVEVQDIPGVSSILGC